MNLKRDWWVLVLVACFVLFAASDPIVSAWMAEYWPIVSILCFGVGLIIGAVWGFYRSKQQYSAGFRAGVNWRKS